MDEPIRLAMDAYRRHDWATAHRHLAAARRATLAPDALVAFGDSAWWLGRTDDALSCYEEAYQSHVRQGRPAEAARLAMGIGALSFIRGDLVVGSGWLNRARRLLDDVPECAEHGYLLSFQADEALAQLDLDRAIAVARQVQAAGTRFRDPTLHSAGLVAEGIALVKQGQPERGLSVLDEAMLPVVAGEVQPEHAGNFYCQVMAVCHELSDVRRARHWTDATERWCDQFSSAVMFAGVCRVHRVQLLQLQGAWDRAEREAARVCEDLADMNTAAVAEAWYQLGETRRLRDDRSGAEDAYQHAHELGRDPQPGMALLRLTQGRTQAALHSLDAALAVQPDDRLGRARLCAAKVEVAVAAGNLAAALQASVELDDVAAVYATSGLTAAAVQARGTVLLAKASPAEAVPVLREAVRRWQELDAPYPAATARTLLAEACLELGDEDGAALELDAATAVFERLGAGADLRRIAGLRNRSTPPDGLTAREVEVLALVAEGMSNRGAGEALFISEKTVARHLANIYAKLGLASRTAAAAYAFEHGLARRRG
jgi:DNA-binding NarL/FixJ family response regulator